MCKIVNTVNNEKSVSVYPESCERRFTMGESRPLTDEECRALEEAYYNCRLAIKANVRRFIKNESLCQECEQEAYLRAAESIELFMASENREGWLVNASTIAAMRARRAEHKLQMLTYPLEDYESVLIAGVSLNFSDEAGRRRIIDLMKSHLSPANGEFFETVIAGGGTNADLAAALGISESAVRSKWKRMIDEIRKLPPEIKNKLEFL